MVSPNEATFTRPFPALTPEQRFHFEVYGYVVLPPVMDESELERVKMALYELDNELGHSEAKDESGRIRARGAYRARDEVHHHFLGNIFAAHPAFTDYGTHPLLVAAAEEVMGSEARIVEQNAHINRRAPELAAPDTAQYGFHRGIDVPYGTHTVNGLFHCSFVKTLTTLTDLGPEDGGTVVIAGSHKLDCPVDDLIALAYRDRSLIHQFTGPAGSTLLFSETLIHATGQLRSDLERVIIITGYGPTMFPYWEGVELENGFREQVPQHLNRLINGRPHWERGPRYRHLTADGAAASKGIGAPPA